jgi:hypothetical protein
VQTGKLYHPSSLTYVSVQCYTQQLLMWIQMKIATLHLDELMTMNHYNSISAPFTVLQMLRPYFSWVTPCSAIQLPLPLCDTNPACCKQNVLYLNAEKDFYVSFHAFCNNYYVFPTNAHYLLHKIFTILAYMFRSQGPSSGHCIQWTPGYYHRPSYTHTGEKTDILMSLTT